MSQWSLCIDFGTAFSKAAAAPLSAWSRFNAEDVRPLRIGGDHASSSPFLLDSAVFVDDRAVIFGRAAIARAEALTEQRRVALRSFKTLLSVSDLDRALNTNAAASIDPHRLFQMRDLIVLYLAYLLSAVNGAVLRDERVSRATEFAWRYAAPAWRKGDSTGPHDTIVRLFGEAEAVRMALTDEALQAPGGLAIDRVREVLPAAMAAPNAFPLGLIFEATAAAAYTSIGLAKTASHLIVVDVGAGTTDLAALVREGPTVRELPDARITLKQASDFIDHTIANVVLDAYPWARTLEDRSALWTALHASMRTIKERVFADGRASLEHDGRTINISMRDIERHPDFKDFAASLTTAYDHSLRVVQEDALAVRSRAIDAIAVGGGAAAPFVKGLIDDRRGNKKVSVIRRPATPEWAHAPNFEGGLAPVFPQLAIAIGGALAPVEMLAAGGLR
jgi:molecular chaperone DnaK (HSP70)